MISRTLLREQEGGIQVNITEVRVKLTEAKKNRLQAFCSITIDNDFVVRGSKGYRRTQRGICSHAQ